MDHSDITRRIALAGLLACLPVAASRAQSTPQGAAPPHMHQDTSAHSMPPNPLGVPMDRAASGTTWIPDAVQLPTRHIMAGRWDLMLHGFVFAQYDKQSGPRGGAQAGSLNWGMFMASHSLAGGRFQARTMLSLDPATVSPRGYPLLLQSGETYNGQALHDRQHPHDFFMELGATYERAVTKVWGFALYAAPSGEPALGPVAFMHRPSAMDNPYAPLGHHWQDATHVAFGVVTAGLFTNRWKLEGSAFNGREPNQDRWDFDRLALDSYSARLTFNATKRWSFTSGYGYIASPEALDPDESIHRVTASVMHGTTIGSEGQIATTFVYGGNWTSSPEVAASTLTSESTSRVAHSALLESEIIFNRRHTLFGRAEVVQKSGEDLSLTCRCTDAAGNSVGGTEGSIAIHGRFNVGSLSLGYVREVRQLRGVTLGLGAMGTLNFVPSALSDTYGSRTPVGGMVFGRLRVPLVRSNEMAGMPGMSMPRD